MKVAAIVLASSLLLAAAGASAQGINDAQIASIVVTANQVDIDAGKLAAVARRQQRRSQGVREAHGHRPHRREQVGGRSGDQAQGHAARTIRPARASRRAARRTSRNLKTLKGAAFDKAYIDHEVAYHEQVLDAVDKTLIPNAKNEELKALLVKVRPAFVAHLEHAKMIQSSMGGMGKK